MNYPNHSFFGAVQTNNSEYSNSSNQEWTRHENKLFENALAELDLNSPALYEKLMVVLPWKTLEQIKSHYEKLIADVAMIERGEISSPNYGDRVDGVDHKRKGAPWTDEEHRLFLIGLDKLGKGEWRNISRYYVKTKTPSQVASHGQKYFRRLKCCTPLDKRRYSIHDIRILNSAIVETSARHPNRHSFITHIPQHDHPNYLAHKKDSVHEQHYSSSVEVNTNAGTANSNNNIGTTSLISSSNNNNSLMIMGNDIAHIGYDQCADYDEFFQPFAMLN